VTRRLTIQWPDDRPFRRNRRAGRIRILAVSDDVDPALDHPENRAALGKIDLVVGAGDLEPDYLSFVADAFVAPLAYVRGNHDAGGAWKAGVETTLPEPLPNGRVRENAGVRFVGLSWPSLGVRARSPEDAAWWQVLPLLIRGLAGMGPVVVVSHVPPRGAGDAPHDPFHTGFAAYRRVAEWLRPPLWIHGHTHHGTAPEWCTTLGPTVVVNVTGSVALDLVPATADEPATEDAARRGR
jgi:hypothetical protein